MQDPTSRSLAKAERLSRICQLLYRHPHGLTCAELARLSAKMEAEGGASLFDRKYLPVYAAKEGVTSWDLFGAVVTALRALVPVVDPLDESLRRSVGLMDLDAALRKRLARRAVHSPMLLVSLMALASLLYFNRDYARIHRADTLKGIPDR
mgnify:CR=1 FL=1